MKAGVKKSPRSHIFSALIGAGALWACLGWACSRQQESPTPETAPQTLSDSLSSDSQIPSPEAQQCARCHREAYDSWLTSQHAWANRRLDPAKDGAAFAKETSLSIGASRFQVTRVKGRPALVWSEAEGQERLFFPEAVIGVAPLWQYLVPAPGGRWQVFPLAWDPAAREWFHVFGEEARDPQEWGHWFNRGNNWNSQCASCHMTGFEKGYDPQTDAYHSRWRGMGVSCLQCHGEKKGHPEAAGTDENKAAAKTPGRAQDTCASCHSRREELTGRFHPGESFEDHYRLVLADQEGVYYPDGQVRQENFEYGSLLMSRMGLKGITCLDCHNPHSGKLLLPVENNALCLSCHQTPGQRGAVPIEPLAHSRHPAGSKGSLCIECHMPVTKYMIRDPRRDHGFTIPDPLLTKELGVPNACNRCHSDRSTEWAVEWTRKWFGSKMDRPSRRRARAIARAHNGDAGVVSELIALLEQEENPAWRAVLLSLLSPWSQDPRVRKHLQGALRSDHPLVRSAALRSLREAPEFSEETASLQDDPSRLVRVDALWSSVVQGKTPGSGLPELVRYLEENADQPPGALKQAQFLLARGEKDKAELWIRKAADWDRSSAYAQFMKGRVLNLLGKNMEALGAFQEAQRLEPENADYAYSLGLLNAELNRSREALELLKKTVQLDPSFGRAWYNLGLAYAQSGDVEPALRALAKAEILLADSPEPAYAIGTIVLQRGDKAKAEEALGRALARNPQFSPALELMSRISQP